MRLLDVVLDYKTLDHVAPFMLSIGGKSIMNKPKIVESVITAAVSAGVIAAGGYFVALPVLQEQVGAVRVQIAEVKSDVKEIKVYMEVRRTAAEARQSVMDERLRKVEIAVGGKR